VLLGKFGYFILSYYKASSALPSYSFGTHANPKSEKVIYSNIKRLRENVSTN
jgi:hypothetical protein